MKKAIVPLVLAVTSGCGGQSMVESLAVVSAAPVPPSQVSRDAGPPVAPSALYVHTGAPYSTCVLSSHGDPSTTMHAVTDHNGIVTLYNHTTKSTTTNLMLDVEYSCANVAGTVRSGTAAAADILSAQPKLSALAATLPSDARVTPALQADPGPIPDATLIAMGYPPRPDPTAAPTAYASWLETVSRPHTLIPNHPVPAFPVRNEASPGVINNSSWSGVEFNQDSAPYFSAFGYWYIPQLSSSNEGTGSVYSALWVGLGGIGSWIGPNGQPQQSLLQSGTYQNGSHWLFGNFFAFYSVWNEWYPGNVQNISFSVSPGDYMNFHSWVGDVNGNWTTSGTYGWTWIIDNTKNTYTYASTPAPSGIVSPSGHPFDGSTVEWIMESPSLNGGPTQLADFGFGEVDSDSFAQATDLSIHQWTTEPAFTLIEMTKNGTPRVQATMGPAQDSPYPYGLRFAWEGP